MCHQLVLGLSLIRPSTAALTQAGSVRRRNSIHGSHYSSQIVVFPLLFPFRHILFLLVEKACYFGMKGAVASMTFAMQIPSAFEL